MLDLYDGDVLQAEAVAKTSAEAFGVHDKAGDSESGTCASTEVASLRQFLTDGGYVPLMVSPGTAKKLV